jgi:hypothetical protein
MLSPFQQAIASAVAAVQAGRYDEATGLIESVEFQAESKLFRVLNRLCIDLDELTRSPDERLARRVVDTLTPLLKPDARVPNPVRFREVLQEVRRLFDADTPEADRRLDDLLDELPPLASSNDDRVEVLDLAMTLGRAERVGRDEARARARTMLDGLARQVKLGAKPSFRDLVRETLTIYEGLSKVEKKRDLERVDRSAWKVWHRATGMLGNGLGIVMPAHHAMIDVSNAIHDGKPVGPLIPLAVERLKGLLDPDLAVPDRPKLNAILKEALALMEQDEAVAWRKAYEMIRDAFPYAEWNAERLALAQAGVKVAFAMGAYEDPTKWANPMFPQGKADALAAVAKLIQTTRTASEVTMDPKTLPEWQAYVATLSGPDLLSKALAANQVAFVRLLEEDGMSPADIAGVFQAFANRLVEDEQPVPSRTEGCYIDYGALAFPTDLSVEYEPE